MLYGYIGNTYIDLFQFPMNTRNILTNQYTNIFVCNWKTMYPYVKLPNKKIKKLSTQTLDHERHSLEYIRLVLEDGGSHTWYFSHSLTHVSVYKYVGSITLLSETIVQSA